MTKTFHFISGLPRSSSTLLVAILEQNPRFHAGMSSPVAALFSSTLANVSAGSEFSVVVSTEQCSNLLRGVFNNFYQDIDYKKSRQCHHRYSRKKT